MPTIVRLYRAHVDGLRAAVVTIRSVKYNMNTVLIRDRCGSEYDEPNISGHEETLPALCLCHNPLLQSAACPVTKSWWVRNAIY